MDIIGKWKVKELGLMQLGDMSMKMFTPAEIENLEDNEDYLQFVSSIYDFSNDGKLDILLEVPKELLENAKKEGLEVKDNVVIIESTDWKKENGEYFYNTHIEGETLGEKVSPYNKINVDGDCLIMDMLFCKIILERA